MSAFRTNEDGSAACRHRDLSVCANCAASEEVVEVVGAHYFVPDPAERAALRETLSMIWEPDGQPREPYLLVGDRVLTWQGHSGTVTDVVPDAANKPYRVRLDMTGREGFYHDDQVERLDRKGEEATSWQRT